MGQEHQLGNGLFVGTDKAICKVLELQDARELKQRGMCRKLACKPIPAESVIELVQELYRQMTSNLGKRKPSAENWRWRPQTYIAPQNTSPEVVLERAIAILAHRGYLAEWSNQLPVASGLVDDKSEKRAAVDLARILEGRLDLYELKWKSHTPIFAAFEILRYGLAYLLCRVNKSMLGYAELETMKASALGLNVLAPRSYYEDLDLAWLQAGLDTGIQAIAQKLGRRGYQASFRFLELPLGPAKPFASGVEAIAACEATPIAPRALALVQAMASLAPVYSNPSVS